MTSIKLKVGDQEYLIGRKESSSGNWVPTDEELTVDGPNVESNALTGPSRRPEFITMGMNRVVQPDGRFLFAEIAALARTSDSPLKGDVYFERQEGDQLEEILRFMIDAVEVASWSTQLDEYSGGFRESLRLRIHKIEQVPLANPNNSKKIELFGDVVVVG